MPSQWLTKIIIDNFFLWLGLGLLFGCFLGASLFTGLQGGNNIRYKGTLGFWLVGKTIGFQGFGRIGSATETPGYVFNFAATVEVVLNLLIDLLANIFFADDLLHVTAIGLSTCTAKHRIELIPRAVFQKVMF